MNKVYFAIVDEDYGGTYIAAPNIKEAKRIALGCDIINGFLENYIDLRVKWQKGIKTDYSGELNIYEINELGLTWWACPDCDKEEFEIIDDETYKCKNCGNTYDIPYENY